MFFKCCMMMFFGFISLIPTFSFKVTAGQMVYISKLPPQNNAIINKTINLFNKKRIGIISHDYDTLENEFEVHMIDNGTYHQLKLRKWYLNLHLLFDDPSKQLQCGAFAVIAKDSLMTSQLHGMTVKIIKQVTSTEYLCAVFDVMRKQYIEIQIPINSLWQWPTYGVSVSDIINASLHFQANLSFETFQQAAHSADCLDLYIASCLQMQRYDYLHNDTLPSEMLKIKQKLEAQTQINYLSQRNMHLQCKKHNHALYVKNLFRLETMEWIIIAKGGVQNKPHFDGSFGCILQDSFRYHHELHFLYFETQVYDWEKHEFVTTFVRDDALLCFPTKEIDAKEISHYKTRDINDYFELLNATLLNATLSTEKMACRLLIIIGEMIQRYRYRAVHELLIFVHENDKHINQTLISLMQRIFDCAHQVAQKTPGFNVETPVVGSYVVIGPKRKGKRNEELAIGKAGVVQQYGLPSKSIIDTEQYVYVIFYWSIDQQLCQSVAVYPNQLKQFMEYKTYTTRRTISTDNQFSVEFRKLERLIIIMFFDFQPKDILLKATEAIGVAYCHEFGGDIFRRIIQQTIKKWKLKHIQEQLVLLAISKDLKEVFYMNETLNVLKYFVKVRLQWSKIISAKS
eukprot:255977_1